MASATAIRVEIQPEFLDAEMAGRLLQMSNWQIYRARREGRLKGYRLGTSGQFRFRRSDVLALLQPVPAGDAGGDE